MTKIYDLKGVKDLKDKYTLWVYLVYPKSKGGKEEIGLYKEQTYFIYFLIKFSKQIGRIIQLYRNNLKNRIILIVKNLFIDKKKNFLLNVLA